MTEPDENAASEGVVRLDVTCIRHYARNPRRHQNPEYDRIKSSILAGGLDQPLVVSQEPGTSNYVLHSGGNTRLSILKELYEETGEQRFRWVSCLLKQWTLESNVLFAHLRENDLRGGLPFIDKALAVFEAKSLLEQELGVQPLSLRHTETLFRERGFGLSHSMISKMGYAVGTLWPVMPNAFSAGLGRPQVERIRALERAARAIWQRRLLGDDTLFDTVFAELCRRHDCPEWDIQPLRDALENEIAVESEQNRQVIHLEMEAQLAGRSFGFPDHPVEEVEQGSDTGLEHVDRVDDGQSTDGVIPADLSADRKSLATPNRKSGTATNKAARTNSVSNPKTSGERRDPGVLRDQLWDCAAALAASHGLHDTVIRLPDQGLGFLLIDVPPQELTDTLDAAGLGLVSGVWWQLAASSELTLAPVDSVLPHLREGSDLYRALAAHDAGLLFESVWTPDPGHLNNRLWQELSPPDWKIFLQLMDTYRTLRQCAFEAGLELWSPDQVEHRVVE